MRALVLMLAVFVAVPATACTTFMSDRGGLLIGKSYDWHQGEALVLVNKRGVAKKALVIEPGATRAEWTSKFASVTFNQYGREMPNGGMNTEGLVVEIMWLNASRYPAPDERPAVSELQWIQYQLDRFATTQQVVDHARTVRVASVYAKVHYLVCDKTAKCAAFEYVDGALKIAKGKDVRALTNSTYERSEAWLDRREGIPNGTSSLSRFGKACRMPNQLGAATENNALKVLEAVKQGDYTKWNIVYDPVKLEVVWRTLAAPTVKRLDLKRFDPSCKSPVKMLDIDTRKAGDQTPRFANYTLEANRSLLNTTTADIKAALPPGVLWLLAGYPETTVCSE